MRLSDAQPTIRTDGSTPHVGGVGVRSNEVGAQVNVVIQQCLNLVEPIPSTPPATRRARTPLTPTRQQETERGASCVISRGEQRHTPSIRSGWGQSTCLLVQLSIKRMDEPDADLIVGVLASPPHAPAAHASLPRRVNIVQPQPPQPVNRQNDQRLSAADVSVFHS